MNSTEEIHGGKLPRKCSHGDRCADSWVHRLAEDAALVARVGDADIPILSPRCTPRILHKPVAFTITDGQDTMVQRSTTSAGQNSTGVVLERSLVGFNCHRDWLLLDGRLHLRFGCFEDDVANTLVTRHTALWNGSAARSLAGTINSFV